MPPMFTSRSSRTVLAALAFGGWLVYMVVGLPLINAIAPTTHGDGPEGLAAFLGLIGGVVMSGLVMWAISD